MIWPIYPQYSLDRRLGGPQADLKASTKRKYPFPTHPRNETLVIQPIT